MDAQVDALDVGAAQPVRIAQLHATVDRGMDHDAARKRLVRVERDLEALAERRRSISRQSRLVEYVCSRPRGASSARGDAV